MIEINIYIMDAILSKGTLMSLLFERGITCNLKHSCEVSITCY